MGGDFLNHMLPLIAQLTTPNSPFKIFLTVFRSSPSAFVDAQVEVILSLPERSFSQLLHLRAQLDRWPVGSEACEGWRPRLTQLRFFPRQLSRGCGC